MNKKIKVGMDISQLAHQGGVATYTRNLSRELSKISDLEMVYFYSSLRKHYHGDLKNVKKFRLPPTLFEMLFNKWRNVGIEKFVGRVDIFHSSDWTQPKTSAIRVTTYHDVVPLKYPQWSTPKIIEVHKRRLQLVEKEIDMVIAVSESTKKDLLEISSIPADKITVIHEGPSADFKVQSKEKIKKFKEKYNLPDKFILAIGGVGERRNLKRIKEAAGEVKVIVSGQDISWLDMGELELLYNSATVLAYCSLYEGFGLPILDAFACGLPVITSNTSSMPEIGGEAATFADPYNVEDISKKLKIIIEDDDLKNDMIKKGFKQLEKFSWTKAAQETADVYRRLLK